MKRIIFINAHCNHLLMSTMSYFLYGIKAPQKYSILFKALTESPDVQVLNYVSPDSSFLPRGLHIPFKSAISRLTCKFVFKKNGYDNIKIMTSPAETTKDDVVLGFVHAKAGCDDIKKFNCKKVINLNQYTAHNINELNQYLQYADDFILEANTLRPDNYLTLAILPKSPHISIVPYVIGSRFQNTNNFQERINKAVVTGTIASFTDDSMDYSMHYNTRLLHKMRQVIYDHKEELNDVIDSFLSPYREGSKVYVIKNDDNFFFRTMKNIYNLFISKKGKQKKYFSFDIVAKYNQYKMAVVPEELAGIPAIGAFEAMACGCAFIGINHPMYSDLGLQPGIHYIAYDGTLENLKSTILFYQNHTEELEKIAQQGHNFVHDRFTKDEVLSLFLKVVK